MGMAYEKFADYNWSTGPAGTSQNDFGTGYISFEGFGPEIAESWKIPEIGTWIMTVRKGIHFALDPTNEASRLMNGRELTADDVVWSVWYLHFDPKKPNSGPRTSIPQVVKALSVEKTGPWEVTLKTPEDPWTGFFWITNGGCSQFIFPREVVEKYGDTNDWRRVIGTGPFMWTDYAPQSVATFTRNPNYWAKNPVGPGKGDQIPYANVVKQFVVPDVSTQLATMRTGRAEWLSAVESEDSRGLFKSNPGIQYKRYLPNSYSFSFRIEKEDLPFKDKRVRQALMMATDFESIKNELYEGDAEIRVWPVAPSWPNIHVPLEQLPESVQALYKYNPEKAKQLLAEAGYPKGFKTKVVVENASVYMDPVAAFKSMWTRVGVDMEIQPRERTTYLSIGTARSWDEMYFGITYGTSMLLIYNLSQYRGATSGWSDKKIVQTFEEMQKHYFIDFPTADKMYRELIPYMMEQAYVIPRPTPYSYTIWQPWLKNHYGETSVTFWTPYAWVDQDMKEKMTGRR